MDVCSQHEYFIVIKL